MDPDADSELFLVGYDDDEFVTRAGKTREQRQAGYFQNQSTKTSAESAEKLKVLKKCWFLEEKFQSRDDLESWKYYQMKKNVVTLESSNGQRRSGGTRKKFGKETIDLVQYTLKDFNARSMLQKGEYELALVNLEEMRKRRNDEPNVWMMFGSCFSQLGQHLKAAESFRNAIECINDLPQAFLGLANSLVLCNFSRLALLVLMRCREIIYQYHLSNPRFSVKILQKQEQAASNQIDKLVAQEGLNLPRSTEDLASFFRNSDEVPDDFHTFVEKHIISNLFRHSNSKDAIDAKFDDEFDPINL